MTHLTLELREDIEYALNEKMNFSQIGDILGYHRTTISSEVKNRRVAGSANLYGSNFVYCEFEATCNNFEGIGCKRKCRNLTACSLFMTQQKHSLSEVISQLFWQKGKCYARVLRT